MIRHLFKLVWNRKRQNFLLLVELFFAFLVVVAVAVVAAHISNNVRQPLGFSIDRLWSIRVMRSDPADGLPAADRPDAGSTSSQESAAARELRLKTRAFEIFRQLSAVVRDLPQVEASTQAWTGPYSNSSWGSNQRLQDGRELRNSANRVADEFLNVVGLGLVAGRWFTREDEGAAWEPVVMNARMARELFGTTDAAGRTIPEREGAAGAPASPPKRVVGVIEDFRQFGALSTPENYMFYRLPADAPTADAQLPEVLLLRLRPGTTADFEETLVRRLEASAPGWSFAVSPVEQLRDDINRQFSIPLIILGAVAAALLTMVALGLTGVVWQSVTQRTREFGLRRATGATAPGVRLQVLGELLVLTSFAVLLGVAVVSQLLFLPLPADLLIVPRTVVVGGVALAAAAVYLVTILSGLYPSRLASRTPPADALHYE